MNFKLGDHVQYIGSRDDFPSSGVIALVDETEQETFLMMETNLLNNSIFRCWVYEDELIHTCPIPVEITFEEFLEGVLNETH